MKESPKPPRHVAVALLGIMTMIFVLSLVFFYFVAFYGLAPGQSTLAGLAFLLVAGPLMAGAMAIALPYRQKYKRRG